MEWFDIFKAFSKHMRFETVKGLKCPAEYSPVQRAGEVNELGVRVISIQVAI